MTEVFQIVVTGDGRCIMRKVYRTLYGAKMAAERLLEAVSP